MENWYERMSLAEQKAKENGICTSDKYSTWAPAGYMKVSEDTTRDYEARRGLK